MNMQENQDAYEQLKSMLSNNGLDKFCYKEKVQIYKIKLMSDLMKQISHQSFTDSIAEVISQHLIQSKLSEQLFGRLSEYEAIVAIPVYAKEANLDKLTHTIMKQSGNFGVVLYVNGYEPAVTEQELIQTIDYIKQLTQQHCNIHIISHLYEQKATMGKIRDHLLSSLYLANRKGHNPVIVGLDADTYHLGKGYIQSAITLAKQPGTAFVKGQLRRMDHEYGQEYPYAYLEDIIEMLFSKYFTNSTSIVSSGGGTSYLLDIAFDVGGYNTATNMGEDIELGYAIKSRYGNKKGKKMPNKVYTSPRRALYAINQGGGILDQWNMESDEFAPIEEFNSQSKSESVRQLDTIIKSVVAGEEVSIDDLWNLNDRISIIIKKLKNVYRKHDNLRETEYKKLKKVYEGLNRRINFVLKNTEYYSVPMYNVRGKTTGIFITHPRLEEYEMQQLSHGPSIMMDTPMN